MQQFNHRNVIRLLGVVIQGLSGPSIVMPFMANGNLSSYLRKNQESNVLPATADQENVCILSSKPLYACSSTETWQLARRGVETDA